MGDPKELSPVQLVLRLRDGIGGRILERTPRFVLWEQALANARELEELRQEVYRLRKPKGELGPDTAGSLRYVERYHEEQAAYGVANAREELERLSDRIKTIADELCGMQPVVSADEALSLIESKANELWRHLENMRSAQPDVSELITAIASGEPVTEAHRDLARAILERWESEAKGE